MNILKRISSLTLNTWRDFTDFHNGDNKILDENQSKSELIDKCQINDEELNFVHRKPMNGFLKRIHGNKKRMAKILDDPRSPTNDFARTPILTESFSGILSPFNVEDMLEAVETAVECKEDTLIFDENQIINAEETDQSKSNEIDVLLMNNLTINDNKINNNEFVKIDEICNWNQIEYQEKPLTESLIVEVSSTMESSSKDSTLNSAQSKESLTDDENRCKIIAYTFKENKNAAEFSASTPKKTNKSSLKGHPKPRTPLVSIGNSPLVYKNSPKVVKNVENPFRKNKLANNKKRILNSNRRVLPKAPSTPMTPLNRNISKNIISFDKENF